MTDGECEFERFPSVSKDNFKTITSCYDGDYANCSFSDCNYESVRRCLKLTCGEKPYAFTTEGMLLILGGFLIFSMICCFIYNYRHNKQIKERVVIMR
mmetsp:Transcript_12906/g.1153  ORF Transcript_12906/g.1153 Transcript_12906/m.1153 type:complete len:98 (+) Transcript_12906:316-609(+)